MSVLSVSLRIKRKNQTNVSLVCLYVSTQVTEMCSLLEINRGWWEVQTYGHFTHVTVFMCFRLIAATLSFIFVSCLCIPGTREDLATAHSSKMKSRPNFKNKKRPIFAHVQHKALVIIVCQAEEWSYHTLHEIPVGLRPVCVLLCHVRLRPSASGREHSGFMTFTVAACGDKANKRVEWRGGRRSGCHIGY